jgi:hypothetical protein
VATCLAVQELTDQVFKNHCRLRLADGVSRHQILFFGARLNPDVLLAKQSTGEDLERTVFGKGMSRFNGKRHAGTESFAVKGNGIHPPHHDSGTLDCRPRLETSNIVKQRAHLVGGLKAQVQQVG